METQTGTPHPTGDAPPNGTNDDTNIESEALNGTGGSEAHTDAEIASTSKNSRTSRCAVCHDQESKYKCSKCYLPYCGIGCLNTHKATHDEDEPVQDVPATATPPPPSNGIPRAGTVAAANFKGPFAALDTSEDLQILFATYPRLASQLNMINTATLPPEHGQDSSLGQGNRGRNGKTEHWTSDRGMEKGKEALDRAKAADGKVGEGVREYYKLVLQILNTSNEVDAAEMIQNEIADENAKIIQELMEGDRG